tara:strand:+ start:660 stop:1775 length:1116 start_codon:yes stop_codon:yes gene_type:complete
MPPIIKPKQPTNAFGQQLPLSEDQDYLGKAIQGLLGAVGLGDDGGKTTTPSPLQRSNRGGQLAGSIPTELLKGLGMGATALAPLISVYKDRAARDAGLKEFIDSVHAFAKNHMWRSTAGTNAWTDAAELFGKSYPRVAAHMRNAEMPLDEPGVTAVARMDWNDMVHGQPGMLEVGKGHLPDLALNDNIASGTMFHEGTHAAQALGNRDTPILYGAASRLLPYRNIPHEASAWFRTDLTESGILKAPQDPRHFANYDKLAARLKELGISLDQSGDTIKLRRWGMSQDPENYIPLDAPHLPGGLQRHLADYQAGLKNRGGWGSPAYSIQTPRQPGNATQRVTETLKYDPLRTRQAIDDYPDFSKQIIEGYLKR